MQQQMPPPMPLLRRQSSIGVLRDALGAMCTATTTAPANALNADALRILHLLLKKVTSQSE